jgi:hypothetical protein
MGRPRSRRRCRSGWLGGFYQVAGLTIRGVAPVDAVVPSEVSRWKKLCAKEYLKQASKNIFYSQMQKNLPKEAFGCGFSVSQQ